jgi:hypothetical protein
VSTLYYLLVWATTIMYIDIFLWSVQVMVATVRCEEISNEKAASFTADEVIIDL